MCSALGLSMLTAWKILAIGIQNVLIFVHTLNSHIFAIFMACPSTKNTLLISKHEIFHFANSAKISADHRKVFLTSTLTHTKTKLTLDADSRGPSVGLKQENKRIIMDRLGLNIKIGNSGKKATNLTLLSVLYYVCWQFLIA